MINDIGLLSLFYYLFGGEKCRYSKVKKLEVKVRSSELSLFTSSMLAHCLHIFKLCLKNYKMVDLISISSKMGEPHNKT